jgi:hypothetical protein
MPKNKPAIPTTPKISQIIINKLPKILRECLICHVATNFSILRTLAM